LYLIKRINKKVIFLLFAFYLKLGAQTYGLIDQQIGHLDGFILYAPLESRATFLIDKCGLVVHQWASNFKPGQSVYLLKNGNLLRAINDSNTAFISGGGGIEKFDWNNRLLWSYKISNSLTCLHHDIYPMPNGNLLAILWEKKTKQEAIAVGRNPDLVGNYVWNEKIIELKPKGKNEAEIVWHWDVWDHLVQDFNPNLPNYGSIKDNPSKLNINYKASKDEDWLHFNAITYNEELDEILISNRNFSEIFIIKHSKNSEGIIYRWGNASAYNSNLQKSQQLFSQHSPCWIPKGFKEGGKIILFNNGITRSSNPYSTVEIVSPAKNLTNAYILDETLKPDWIYSDTSAKKFYSKNVSNAQVLKNGNVLICEGAKGRFFEIDERKNIVWQYVNPIGSKGLIQQGQMDETNRVFRCTFYSKNYSGIKKIDRKTLKASKLNQSSKNCIPGQK
jgi:hypothetical protein